MQRMKVCKHNKGAQYKVGKFVVTALSCQGLPLRRTRQGITAPHAHFPFDAFYMTIAEHSSCCIHDSVPCTHAQAGTSSSVAHDRLFLSPACTAAPPPTTDHQHHSQHHLRPHHCHLSSSLILMLLFLSSRPSLCWLADACLLAWLSWGLVLHLQFKMR